MISINTKIELGGIKQRIHVITNDTSKPVLLFLHGGPGVCDRHSVIIDQADLLDTFTVVAWDQRGTGGSYYGVAEESLTIDQLTRDAAELVEWLCDHFGKDKIFVIGGSWGSVLGTWLAYRFPEHMAAFVGYGQVVDGERNEKLSYEFTLKAAKEAGDEKAVATLEEVGPPIKGTYKGGFDGLMAQRNVMMKYGGYSQDEGQRSYYDAVLKPVFASGEYTPADLYGLIRGYKRVLTAMWPEVGAVNFPKTCTEFKVPFFIFDGRLDMNTPAELVEGWYNQIVAPKKELIWFDNSGHNPIGDEPERFKELLRDRLMAVKAEIAEEDPALRI